ncbi:hypothetical protein XA68_16601 [Ophiocordyceps unilateralis]|uniref:Uncharacterized protein n=1 Tax=Ophiocordyceps unilateralis TaxID=268505 RepID=A0A2A9P4G1_OPHUN|nr:hypothetical protein XA68_16601 [Ophiocordyceps unilateralis]
MVSTSSSVGGASGELGHILADPMGRALVAFWDAPGLAAAVFRRGIMDAHGGEALAGFGRGDERDGADNGSDKFHFGRRG